MDMPFANADRSEVVAPRERRCEIAHDLMRPHLYREHSSSSHPLYQPRVDGLMIRDPWLHDRNLSTKNLVSDSSSCVSNLEPSIVLPVMGKISSLAEPVEGSRELITRRS